MPKRSMPDEEKAAALEQIKRGAGLDDKKEIKKRRRKDLKAEIFPDKSNYYKMKRPGKDEGTVKYKLTLPLPVELVKRLKIEAIMANKSLSALIQEKLEK